MQRYGTGAVAFNLLRPPNRDFAATAQAVHSAEL